LPLSVAGKRDGKKEVALMKRTEGNAIEASQENNEAKSQLLPRWHGGIFLDKKSILSCVVINISACASDNLNSARRVKGTPNWLWKYLNIFFLSIWKFGDKSRVEAQSSKQSRKVYRVARLG
jgi:hypothetical protein